MNTRLLAAAGAAVALATLTFATIVQAQTPASDGAQLYSSRCKFCHEPASGGAPDREGLAAYAKSDIVDALTTGAMVAMARGMSPQDIDAIATYLVTPAGAAAPADAAAPATPATPAAEPSHEGH